MKKILLLVLLLCNANAFAGLYKWVDENNQTHYSEQAPSGKKAKVLASSSSASDAAASEPTTPKTIAERAAELNKAKLAKKGDVDKAAQKQAYTDALKENCEGAKRNLASLQSGIRLVEIDAKGERSYVTDEQRQQKTAKAQQDIQESCK
jgi:hypothetical protein